MSSSAYQLNSIQETEKINIDTKAADFNHWLKVDPLKKYRGFFISKDGSRAGIKNEGKNAALKKIVCDYGIKDGINYHIFVPCEIIEEKHKLSVYALITLCDSTGNETRRMYLDDTDGGKTIVFKSCGEKVLKIELGLKTYGEVIWYLPEIMECLPVHKRMVKIAATNISNNSSTYEERRKIISDAFDKAGQQMADIVLFAETINNRSLGLKAEERLETLNGSFCTMMSEKCQKYNCYAFFSFLELDAEGNRRNTAVLMDRSGKIAASCGKTHLAITEYEMGLVPGDSYCVADTDFGRVGLLICWDAYFPEPARAMTLKGAELLLISTAGNSGLRHIVRAKENGVYVAVSCCGRTEDGIMPTKIIDPAGTILAATETENDIAFADIDLNDKKYIHWLSVGDCNAIPNNVYMHEYRPDLIREISEQVKN